ncbi:MAG: hypothetical protein AAF914_14535 [Pseudomonadota bacterium]
MTIFFQLFGAMMIGGIVAVVFERWGLTHNGIIPSVLIALGAVIAMFMIQIMFRLSLGSPGLDAIVAAAAALVLVPTEWANKRRNRRR